MSNEEHLLQKYCAKENNSSILSIPSAHLMSVQQILEISQEKYKGREYREALVGFKNILELSNIEACIQIPQLLSIISKCYYKLKLYRESIEYSQQVLKSIRIIDNTIEIKNRMRIIKSYYRIGDREETDKYLQKTLDGYPMGITGKLPIIIKYGTRIRPTINYSKDLNVSIAPMEKTHQEISYLYGGLGVDIGNVLLTFADVHRRSSSLKNTHFHLTLSDKSPSIVARNIIIFWLLNEIGYAITLESIYQDSQHSDLGILLFYLYNSTMIPTFLCPLLVRRLDLIILFGDIGKIPDWLQINQSTWSLVRPIFEYWRTEVSITANDMRNMISHHTRDLQIHSSNTGTLSNNEIQLFKKWQILLSPASTLSTMMSYYQKLTHQNIIMERESLATRIDREWIPNLITLTMTEQLLNPFEMVFGLFSKIDSTLKNPSSNLFDYFIQVVFHCGKGLRQLTDNNSIHLEINSTLPEYTSNDIFDTTGHTIGQAHNTKKMKITIKTLNGYNGPLEVDSNDTAMDLKNKILQMNPKPFGDELLSVDQQRLILPTNKAMEDSATVEGSGLQENSVVTLIVRLKKDTDQVQSTQETPVPTSPDSSQPSTPQKQKKKKGCLIQ
ncbi:hypothetical protein DLAC_08291 [Tieghemostelium lacteum]|uniref:Ubiquitin-like domain-containing protein n=1 Tax=Tieghemostelium lacteum TaxID=361077 RepID=A0A151ZBL8_TIELA|nr:hypothetical protein DLAC_08291 [Tieghemostelium lacteum]|eukprot:KYQ91343.1 hypothetical protein DLAC_08291 [Tieghemostelium lacteum]